MHWNDLMLMRHEFQLLLIILILLGAEIYYSGRDRSGMTTLAVVLFGLHAASCWTGMGEGTLFGGMYHVNPMIHFMKNTLDLGVLVVLLLTAGWARKVLAPQERISEFYLLLFSSLLGMYYLVSAGDLLMLYLGLELSALPVAALAAYELGRMRSAEAGIKMILLAGFASAFTLMGISLLYGATGSFSMDVLARQLQGNPLESLGFLFFFAGIAFKLSLVPFHFWTPDVYEGAPVGVSAYLSVVSKGAAVFILLIIMAGMARAFGDMSKNMLYYLALLTMTVGNLFALRQQNIKRLLAYSAVAQAGFIMLGFLADTQAGRTSVPYFILVYVFSNLAAFGVVQAISDRTGKEELSDYEGLYRSNPRLALVMMLALFSLAGIPPLAGFFGKFFLFMSAASAGLYYLVLAAVLNAVVSLYYYLLVVRAMFLRKSDTAIPYFASDAWMRAGLLICVVGILVLGMSSGVYEWVYGLGQ